MVLKVLAIVALVMAYGILGDYWRRNHRVGTACMAWAQGLWIFCAFIAYIADCSSTGLVIAVIAATVGTAFLGNFYWKHRLDDKPE